MVLSGQRINGEAAVTVDRARLRGPEGTPNESRSWWLHEALAADPGAPCPPLVGRVRADVAIVGGGYTGLWTAFHLKQADPGADVVLLEQTLSKGASSRIFATAISGRTVKLAKVEVPM